MAVKFIESLCPPALLYLIFLVIQIGLDLVDMRFWTATSKVVFGGAAVYVLDLLCQLNLGVVSWFIVAMPFIVTTLATSIALGLQLDNQLDSLVAQHIGKK